MNGVAAVWLDAIGGDKIDRFAQQCLQSVGQMHEAESHGPAEGHQQINVALRSLVIAGMGTKKREAGDGKLLGQDGKVLSENRNNLCPCQQLVVSGIQHGQPMTALGKVWITQGLSQIAG